MSAFRFPWRLAAGAALLAAAAVEALAAGPEAAPSAPLGSADWSFHFQATLIPQGDLDFSAPYSGRLSLSPNSQLEPSFTSTAFIGRRLWPGAELYVDPEAAGGAGLSRASGIAGFPNGEITRVGTRQVTPYLARAVLRQQWDLGGAREEVAEDLHQLSGSRCVSRVTLTAGKFSVLDVFDQNSYAGDPRGEFMNWALMANGAFDYPADTRGYTIGAALEYRSPAWAARAGVFMEPQAANGEQLDSDVGRAHGQALEVERRLSFFERPGAVRFLSYLNDARMGSYQDSLALAPANPDINATRRDRIKYGFGLNAEQELRDGLGVFLRLGWNDGRSETWAFTEIDRTASSGLRLKGGAWKRPEDAVGLALVVNGISADHERYLQAGGYGFIIGDGRLNYGLEKIVETYYLWQALKPLALTLDFQQVVNPAYNRDRGPVSIGALRAHLQF